MHNAWPEIPFGEVVEFATGQVDPRNEPYASMPHVGPDNIAIGGTSLIGEIKKAGELGLISGKYLFDSEAIVYSKIRPNLNKVCVPGISGVCSADMYPLWVRRPDFDRDFVCQFMRSPIFVARAVATSMRTGLPKINRSELENLPVSAPPIQFQCKIAEILRTWDNAIEQSERLIDGKERTFAHLARSVLVGHRRVMRKRSNWRGVSLLDVTTELTSRNSGRLGVDSVMGVRKFEGMIPMKEHVRAADLSRYKIVVPSAFAYNPMRLNIGSLARNDHGRDILVSPDYVAFAVNDGELDAGFFDHLRRTRLWSRFVESAGTGGVRIRIYYDDLADFGFDLPPIEEQREIVAILDTARREIALLRSKRDALHQQKRGLMQKLLTGEWRVRVEGEAGQ